MNPLNSCLPPASALSPARLEPRRQVRTLLADDSPMMLELVGTIIEQLDMFKIVGVASDGCRAVQSVLKLSPELVILDFRMPHLDGLEAARYIKAFTSPPTVILMTSDEDPGIESQAFRAGADGFVRKGPNLRRHLALVLFSICVPLLGGPDALPRHRDEWTSKGKKGL